MHTALAAYDFPVRWPTEARLELSRALETARPTVVAAARAKIAALGETGLRPFALGVVSTFTISPLLASIDLALTTLDVMPKLIAADPDTLEDSLLNPTSAVREAEPDALLVLWRLEDLAPALRMAKSGEEFRRHLEAADDRLNTLIRQATQAINAPLFFSTLPPCRPMGRHISSSPSDLSIDAARSHLNGRLRRLAGEIPGLFLFDFSAWATMWGARAFDLKMDLFAHQPISAQGMGSLALAIRRALAPLLRPARKVLALDLDDTLWGGILGEDGLGGLQIGRDFPGNVYWRIQEAALTLKHQGVLLVLLSKNDWADVESAFAARPDWPLRLADFAALHVNWRPKHEGLRAAARALDLGVDSFAFLDDQAFEREEMAFQIPEIAVLETNGTPLSLLAAIEDCPCFDLLRLSESDTLRARDYASRVARQRLETSSGSAEAFLGSLQLRAIVAPLSPATLARGAQMLERTNQFNTTTRRHHEAALRRMMIDPRNILLTLALSDRFSDQGTIGLAIALAEDAGPKASLMIDSFLLSCRALGRGAERALWAALVDRATRLGYTRLEAEYLPTARNGQCATLYEALGMTCEHEEESGRKFYSLGLPAAFEPPPWIAMEEIEGR